MLQWGSTDQAGQHGVKCLVYGGPGAGKTRLIATAPAPIIASAESGLLSLQQMKIPFAKIASISDLTEFYQFCASSTHAKAFQTIAIDSISEIAEQVLANEKKRNKDARAAYGELAERVVEVVRWFRDLPGFNVYVSAKMEFTKDEAGRMVYLPMMPGQKLGQALPYYFDEVFQLGKVVDAQNKSWEVLRTANDLQHPSAKDRSGRLAVPFEQPHLGQLFNKITGV